MPTILQRNLAENIVKNIKNRKPKTKKELVVSSGYSEMSAESSAHFIIEQKGVQEALEEFGFTEDNAKKVVAEILLSDKTQASDRLRAASEVFKVKGSYAPEKTINANMNVSIDIEEKANEAISRFLKKK